MIADLGDELWIDDSPVACINRSAYTFEILDGVDQCSLSGVRSRQRPWFCPGLLEEERIYRTPVSSVARQDVREELNLQAEQLVATGDAYVVEPLRLQL